MYQFRMISILSFGLYLTACQLGNFAPTVNAATTDTNTAPVSVVPAGSVSSNKLSGNDVSILFPMPTTPEAVDNLLIATEIKKLDGQAVLTEEDFGQLIDIAQGTASREGRRQIKFPEATLRSSAWKIAGIRFDPTAPGGSDLVREKFGSRPQVRLIIQPVTVSGREVTVHDMAFHIIFDYVDGVIEGQPGHVPKSIPDMVAVRSLIEVLNS